MSPNAAAPLHLFEAFGIELEYMLVDRETLAIRPIADELLRQVGGGYEMEVERGPIAWSNELALHVIELKTNGPVAQLAGVEQRFQSELGYIAELLAPAGARLLPTAMHPTMDSQRELRLWPHEDDVIYQTLHRIFDCRGHGWANLQSMHINLPFHGDEEFGRLHAAIRLVLPILPALAASSPLADGAYSGALDTRLSYYRDNARVVPSVTGLVVPEPVFTRARYEGELLQGIYDDMAARDPDGVLRHEWINARGAIARFDRSAIEIRVLDLQECPAADIAIARAVVAVVQALVEERGADLDRQRRFASEPLAAILSDTIVAGDESTVTDLDYLEVLGLSRQARRAGALWRELLELHAPQLLELAPIARIFEQGCLARRITSDLGPDPTPERIATTYRRLGDCLDAGTLFSSDGA